MNYAAIRHEATSRYCYCLEPGRFLFRIETAKDDMAHVWLFSRDKYLPLHKKDTRRVVEMKKVASDGLRDYYEAELTFHMVCLRYCFELEDRQGNRRYLSGGGFTRQAPEDIERMFDCPQTLREEERFQIPRWAANRVVYQIFPSRFATDKKVDPRRWYKTPIPHNAQLGGNLPGITEKLPYIRDLGADVIYMTPIFQSPSTHKYDTVDYYTIDPGFGTTEDLCRLVETAHRLGMRVILDAVFNHSSREFFAFADLNKNGEASPYRDWYYPQGFPLKMSPGLPNYKCFGYHGYMPKLNLQNPDTADYFINVALYWLRTAGIDGWRLDVGDEVSHSFWRKFRAAVKAEFPEALIVGEVWHHAPDFLEGDQWDSVMNYPFFRAVMDFVAGGSMTASEFLDALGLLRGTTHNAVFPILWNLIGSHDTSRILHCCGGSRTKHHLAAALQLLTPGMPMIYYGDEVGMGGGADPDCRRGMLWEEKRQDKETLNWYKALLRVRREHPAITQGEIIRQEAWDALGLIRLDKMLGSDQVTVLLHNQEASCPLPELAGRRDLLTGKVFDGTLCGITALVLEG